MISLRNFRLETTMGHVIEVIGKEPTYIPPECVDEAAKRGMTYVDNADAAVYDDLSRAKSDVHGELRRSIIYLAIKSIAADNNAKDFTAGGIPKVPAVEQRLGFDVTQAEIRDVYQLYQSAITGNGEFALHPQSQNLLKVIEATTKDELDLLAVEFGIDGDKAEALNSRDLRRLLMTKFSGVSVA
jgi:hypothetical protein